MRFLFLSKYRKDDCEHMKICRDALQGTQVMYDQGFVLLCCNIMDGVIGLLSQNTMEEIWNGEKARSILMQLANGDYSRCDKKGCPYLASGKPENIPLVEVDELPRFPTHLSLSYERKCNYKCTVCSAHNNETSEELEIAKNRIEENLKSILPRLKCISSNGRGEVFASKRILKQLASWQPISPPEECSVRLETNGSLFDEEHWKQIENLGKYHLQVAITVMSFDEHIYQTLSGVKIPISKIENNLRFVKKLREQNVINHLELATVVQDRNFRTMPEFTRRCIEEFGADTVRLRPVIADVSNAAGWFTDVRGAYHPYHKEYLEVMNDPIFKNPKVVDWGAWNDSETGDLPERVFWNMETQILSKLIVDDSLIKKINNYVKFFGKRVIIFGIGAIALSLAKIISKKNKVECILNLNNNGNFYNIPIISLSTPPPL